MDISIFQPDTPAVQLAGHGLTAGRPTISQRVSGWNTAMMQSAQCHCMHCSGPWTSWHLGTVTPLQCICSTQSSRIEFNLCHCW